MTLSRYYGIRVPFIQWSALVIASGIALAWLWQRGVMSTLASDTTGTVYLLAIVFSLSMLQVGKVTWRLSMSADELNSGLSFDEGRIKHSLAWPRMVANYSPLLGLLGTVAGLQMQVASSQGTDGLSTAFGCTMAGIFSSVVLGVAIHNCTTGARQLNVWRAR